MPDNPDVATLLAKSAAARDAQAKLRDAMAAVAAEVATVPAVPPSTGGAQ